METGNFMKLEHDWKVFFRFAAVCALLIVAMGITDVVVSMSAGEATINSAVPVTDWFALFQTNPVSAFSNLGMINIINLTLAIPIFLALIYAQRSSFPAFGLFTGVLFLLGVVVYYSSNTVFSMFALSKEYLTATDAQRPFIEAAGRALLARGADLSAGTFCGLFFAQAASVCMGFLLLKTRLLGKVAPWLAIIGYAVMVVFFFISAFFPENFAFAMMLSAPGGLLLMAFQILVAIHFFRLAR